MKVRIQGNSFRFRLKQPEVDRLIAEGSVTETVEFGAAAGCALSFVLQVTQQENFSVAFQSDSVVFSVPAAISNKWISTNSTGFEDWIDTGFDRKIKLLVEKDFRCMEACAEENAGSYEQPFH